MLLYRVTCNNWRESELPAVDWKALELGGIDLFHTDVLPLDNTKSRVLLGGIVCGLLSYFLSISAKLHLTFPSF